MRTAFPGHFRPTNEGFVELWRNCIFAVDANVLLNLYRYSTETRIELEKAISSIQERIFIPHQAAKEFLRNRLTVTASQAEEYTKAGGKLREILSILSNRKKHPFLFGDELSDFCDLIPKLLSQLEEQKKSLISRLTNDEILDFIESAFSGRIGVPFSDKDMLSLAAESDARYQAEIPPGYKDGKKDVSGDSYRKYGDLIIWKQLIERSNQLQKPIIFITDDRKEDWWLEQSGKTIGPRTELREEFIKETKNEFWMYTVDKFMEEAARASNTAVSPEAIAEVVEISEEIRAEKADEEAGEQEALTKIIHPVLAEKELLGELKEFLDSHPSDDCAVGLKYFVVNYLGSQNYEINHSYARLNELANKGLVEIFKVEKNGASTVRVCLAKNG